MKNDVLLYRYIQNAAFIMRALEFNAELLFSNTAVNSDLVSLVKFGDNPSIEFSREPISWLVYNRILAHRNTQRYVDRKNAPLMDELTGGSTLSSCFGKGSSITKFGIPRSAGAFCLLLFRLNVYRSRSFRRGIVQDNERP